MATKQQIAASEAKLATKQQIPVLIARLVEFQEAFSTLPADKAQWAIMNGRKAAEIAAAAILKYKVENEVSSLLSKSIMHFSLKSLEERFLAREKLIIGENPITNVRIAFLSDRFCQWFGDISLPYHPGGPISWQRLENYASDWKIIKSLGRENAAVCISSIYIMMLNQAAGDTKHLREDGSANIFYCPDIDGKLRTVLVGWSGLKGWAIDAQDINQEKRQIGRRVFGSLPVI